MSRASPSAPTAAEVGALPPPPPPSYGVIAMDAKAAISSNPFDEVGVSDDILDLEQLNPNPEPTDTTSPEVVVYLSQQSPAASDRAMTGASPRAAKGSSSPATGPTRRGGGRGSKGGFATDDAGTCNDRKPGCCDRPCCRRCSDCCFRCTARCTRVLLVVPNIVFLLFGATLVGLGVWMRADRESQLYLQILRAVPAGPLVTVDQMPVAIIAVGSCIAILSFLGCCGACFESVCFLCLYACIQLLLVPPTSNEYSHNYGTSLEQELGGETFTYALFLVLMVVAEIAIGIVIAVMQEQLLVNITDSLSSQVKNNYNSSRPVALQTTVPPVPPYALLLTTAWDNMHDEFHCCGAVGPEDFKYSAWSNWTGEVIPPSCCINTSATMTTARTGSGSPSSDARQYAHCREAVTLYLHWKANPLLYTKGLEPQVHRIVKTQGCRQSLLDRVRHHLMTLIGIVCAVVLLQVVDFGFACVLMNWFRKKQAECAWYDDDDYD